MLICITGRAQMSQAEKPAVLTLQECVSYALKNQPVVGQSRLDEEINRKDINISLSGWLPQVNLTGNLQHYFELPTTFYTDPANPSGPKLQASSGLPNTSAAQFSADQALYSTGLVFSGRIVHDLRLRATQNTQSSKIQAVVDVSKSFYEVILAIEQLDLWTEDIQRLERSYEDALHLFQNGLTDKIDYQQALIAVNNARAQQRNTQETIRAKYSVLKQTMGYPAEKQLVVSYDSASVGNDILADTLEQLQYDKRIEYQLMETGLHLQNAEIGYYRWSFLPAISAFYDYNLNYENETFSPLYRTSFPNSLIGVTFTLPIFQGASRWQNLQKSHLQYQRMQLGQEDLKNRISVEYSQAMASYKSNLYALRITRENISVAQDVFNTVTLQYQQGVKAYLDVIVAETDLRTAKLNYLGTLFQLLSSKLDLDAAMGDITVQ